MLFELYSFTLGLHHDSRFLHLPEAVQLTRDALEKTIVSYQSPGSNGNAQANVGANPAPTPAATYTSHQTDSR